MGHIQKRLGKRLRDLKKKTFVDDSGQVRNIKWGGKGHLTESVTNSLSVYKCIYSQLYIISVMGLLVITDLLLS